MFCKKRTVRFLPRLPKIVSIVLKPKQFKVEQSINPCGLPVTGTLPTLITDAELLPSEVAVAVVGAATVVPAVRDVAGLALPVLVALAVHPAGSRVARRALSVSGAVVRTRVDAGQRKKKQKKNKAMSVFTFGANSLRTVLIGNWGKINEYHLV